MIGWQVGRVDRSCLPRSDLQVTSSPLCLVLLDHLSALVLPFIILHKRLCLFSLVNAVILVTVVIDSLRPSIYDWRLTPPLCLSPAMAVPLQHTGPIGPDTLITVKVVLDGQNRRFKLALRDLGAHVLPQKVSHHQVCYCVSLIPETLIFRDQEQANA